jgi:hypothetical protein
MSVEAHTCPDPLRFHREHEHLSGAFGGDSFGKKAEAFARSDARHREEIAQSAVTQERQLQALLEQNTRMTEEIDKLTQQIHRRLTTAS